MVDVGYLKWQGPQRGVLDERDQDRLDQAWERYQQTRLRRAKETTRGTSPASNGSRIVDLLHTFASFSNALERINLMECPLTTRRLVTRAACATEKPNGTRWGCYDRT